MLRYVIKRVLMMVVVLLGVVTIVFLINQFSGDPVISLLPIGYTEEQYAAKQAELGLDQPRAVQFWEYLKGVATELDLGTSYQTNRPVRDMVLERYPTTMKLAVISTLIAVILGIPFGIISATKQYSPLDYSVSVTAMFFASMPTFWLGLMLIIVLSLHFKLFPASGLDGWKSWVLPSLAIGLSSVATICRTTRSSMLDVIRQDYVRTARSKGLTEMRIIRRHALKNAIIPVITVIGLQFGFIAGGAMVIEAVFSIPGLGMLVMTAVNQKDFPVTQGAVLVIALTVCVINLLIDITYGFFDPRIKSKYAGKKRPRRPEKNAAKGGDAA